MTDSAFTFSTPSAPVPVFTVNSIDAKNIANTLGYTNSTSQTLVFTGGVIRCISASAITDGPTLGIGTTAGNNNIFTSTPIHTLTTTSSVFSFTTFGISQSIPPGGTVYINLSNPSTGTSQTIALDINGYFV